MKEQSKMFIGFATLLLVGTLLFIGGSAINMPITQAPSPTIAAISNPSPSAPSADDKTQVVYIYVNHGYQPHVSHAKAGEPTRLSIETAGVYDCTAAINIPALSMRKFLPATGVTNIDIPPQEKGSTLTVLCAMGMYSFDIKFD